MTDLATVKRLAEHTAESVTSLEQDIELLIASGRNLARALDDLDKKVKDSWYEYRRNAQNITETLTFHQVTLERVLEKVRAP